MKKSDFLSVAIKAAKAAEKVIQHYYLSNLTIDLKEDHSPVTIADLEAEKAILSVIKQAFPEHGFWGEETGKLNASSEYLWLIDPIDGTKSFVRQQPMFSTQIALMHRGELIVGVSNAPIYQEIAYAEKGQGVFINDQPVKVSHIDCLKLASLSIGNVKTLATTAAWGRLATLIQHVDRVRGYGDFLHYHFLASGKIDLIIESDINILDVAALSVLIGEAGGVLTNLDGSPLTVESSTVLAASTPNLHRAALETINY